MKKFIMIFTKRILKQLSEIKHLNPMGQITCVLMLMFLSACSKNEFPEGTETHVKKFYGVVAGDEPRSVLEARKILSVGGSAADAATAMYSL